MIIRKIDVPTFFEGKMATVEAFVATSDWPDMTHLNEIRNQAAHARRVVNWLLQCQRNFQEKAAKTHQIQTGQRWFWCFTLSLIARNLDTNMI